MKPDVRVKKAAVENMAWNAQIYNQTVMVLKHVLTWKKIGELLSDSEDIIDGEYL